MSEWRVIDIDPTREHWQTYLDHLKRVKMLTHATEDGDPKPDGFYFGILTENECVGHISIRKQPLTVPASHLTEDKELPLSDSQCVPLVETFVNTFAVEKAYQRRGYGRALQEAALKKTRELGCYQMRSWSSADKSANYALKLSMGFAVHPALYPLPGGKPLSGVYFTKVIVNE